MLADPLIDPRVALHSMLMVDALWERRREVRKALVPLGETGLERRTESRIVWFGEHEFESSGWRRYGPFPRLRSVAASQRCGWLFDHDVLEADGITRIRDEELPVSLGGQPVEPPSPLGADEFEQALEGFDAIDEVAPVAAREARFAVARRGRQQEIFRLLDPSLAEQRRALRVRCFGLYGLQEAVYLMTEMLVRTLQADAAPAGDAWLFDTDVLAADGLRTAPGFDAWVPGLDAAIAAHAKAIAELGTRKQQIEAIDEDIADLQRQREAALEELQRYRSPKQLAARRSARARYLGEAVLASPLDPALVERAGDLAGEEHWLFEPSVLADDGLEFELVDKGAG